MPTVETAQFGVIEYQEETEIQFPVGLPAFERERRFIVVRRPQNEPLVFLQSLSSPALAFLAIAVQDILLDYPIELSDDDADALGGPGLADDFDILALITIAPSGEVSANLQAPIVIHRERRRAVQAIQFNPAYSCRHPLGAAPSMEEEPPCS